MVRLVEEQTEMVELVEKKGLRTIMGKGLSSRICYIGPLIVRALKYMRE